MKVKVNKNELREAIGRINKIMKKDSMAIYCNKLICMDVCNGQILLTGVQSIISMRTTIDGVVMDEPFSCLIDGNMVMALLSKMTNDSVILEYDASKRNLFLQDESHAKMKLRCEDKDVFAGWKELKNPDFEKETNVLVQFISSCKHALPTREQDKIMSSFCIQYGDDHWKVMALDGSRMSSRGNITKAESTILVLGETVTMLESIFQDKKITVSVKNEDMWIRDGVTEVYLRTVTGKYYNLKSITDQDYKYTLTIDRVALESALTLAHVSLLNETTKVGVFTFNENALEIKTTDRIGNESKNVIEYSGEMDSSLCMGMNIKYFLDAVKSIPDDTITLQLISKLHPLMMSGANYTEIVLPTKIKS